MADDNNTWADTASDFWGDTPGAVVYIGDETAGLISTTPPAESTEIKRALGWAIGASILYFNPSAAWEVLS
jgi:hypothetical protein